MAEETARNATIRHHQRMLMANGAAIAYLCRMPAMEHGQLVVLYRLMDAWLQTHKS